MVEMDPESFPFFEKNLPNKTKKVRHFWMLYRWLVILMFEIAVHMHIFFRRSFLQKFILTTFNNLIISTDLYISPS